MPESFEFPDSAFKKGRILTFPDGDSILIRDKITHTANTDDNYHLISESDTLGDIAHRYYKNCKLWWIIADVNLIDHPLLLNPGDTLIIPKLSNISNGQFE